MTFHRLGGISHSRRVSCNGIVSFCFVLFCFLFVCLFFVCLFVFCLFVCFLFVCLFFVCLFVCFLVGKRRIFRKFVSNIRRNEKSDYRCSRKADIPRLFCLSVNKCFKCFGIRLCDFLFPTL